LAATNQFFASRLSFGCGAFFWAFFGLFGLFGLGGLWADHALWVLGEYPLFWVRPLTVSLLQRLTFPDAEK
jgi:hypothetical protein